jgi:hypothetical protein
MEAVSGGGTSICCAAAPEQRATLAAMQNTDSPAEMNFTPQPQIAVGAGVTQKENALAPTSCSLR